MTTEISRDIYTSGFQKVSTVRVEKIKKTDFRGLTQNERQRLLLTERILRIKDYVQSKDRAYELSGYVMDLPQFLSMNMNILAVAIYILDNNGYNFDFSRREIAEIISPQKYDEFFEYIFELYVITAFSKGTKMKYENPENQETVKKLFKINVFTYIIAIYQYYLL